MNLNHYQSMYKKMEMSDEMDERIRDAILNKTDSKRMRRRKSYRAGLAVAAAFAIAICITRFDSVVAAAEKVIDIFTYTFILNDADGDEVEIDMIGEYLTLSPDAPTEYTYMDSMTDVGEEIGVKLLDTDEFYAYEDCVEYEPFLTEDGELYGVMLSDKLYAVGDLENVTLYPKESEEGIDWMEYSAGAKYQTPMSVQVTIRTDKDAEEDYKDDALGYVSKSQQINLTKPFKNTFDAEVYDMKNLGVKAVLYSVQTDGPMSWGIEDGSITCTSALFVYQGVEYVYMGGIDHDTMKAFLDTLE